MGKRLLDICFSLAVLALGAPLFLVCMAAVKISSRGSVFYAHPRIGMNGQKFGCLKFRTMYPDAAARLEPLLASNPMLMQEWKTYFKLKNDPRVTLIGKFLRKTSLDELPQVWNVLIGQMSVVGPRPLTEYEVKHYLGTKAEVILSVRPGLTNLWVTQGRNRFSLEQRVEMEERYVKTRSMWLDIWLIFKTIWVMIFPKGAY